MTIGAVTFANILTDSGVSATDRITNDNTLTVSGTYDRLAGTPQTLRIFVVDSLGNVVGGGPIFSVRDTSTPAAGKPWSGTVTLPADGTYTVWYSINDPSPTTTFPGSPIVLDTVPPATPVFVSGDLDVQPDELVGGQTYVYQTEPNAIVTVTFTQGSTTITKTATADASGLASVTLSEAELIALGTGIVDVKAQAADIAGNLSGVLDLPDINLVICFLEGTLIATPSGDVPVETLSPGDLVLTADGRAVPVRFLGKQTVVARFASPERANPIRIAAGALAENVPARDLLVSPNHGIVVDGVLCFASALANGTTITQVDAPAEVFAYYAIETEGHEIILAEGCPAETFMDHVPRARWDNYRDYVALYGEVGPIAEMDLPHAKSHRQVPADIHARIAERAAALRGPARDAA